MVDKIKEALEMAIEALEDAQNMIGDGGNSIPNYFLKPINACKEALEQPMQNTETMAVAIALQEQIRQLKDQPTNMVTVPLNKLEDMQRRLKVLKPLSDDEITKAVLAIPVAFPSIFGIARAIERAHGIGE